jgi:hypothetical protein
MLLTFSGWPDRPQKMVMISRAGPASPVLVGVNSCQARVLLITSPDGLVGSR